MRLHVLCYKMHALQRVGSAWTSHSGDTCGMGLTARTERAAEKHLD